MVKKSIIAYLTLRIALELIYIMITIQNNVVKAIFAVLKK